MMRGTTKMTLGRKTREDTQMKFSITWRFKYYCKTVNINKEGYKGYLISRNEVPAIC